MRTFPHVSAMTDSMRIVNPLPGMIPVFEVPSIEEAGGKIPVDFANLLADGINNVNNLAKASEKLTVDLALGKPVELHQIMLASTKASIALELLIEIRNKVLEAYQEISRMPV